jgi:uncharacterized OB-fold protein
MIGPDYGDDWTGGIEAIVYETCRTCGTRWYFARTRCPACGGVDLHRSRSRGEGTLQAVTTVTRAPSPELRALVPYRVALVDLDEGFRMMGHAEEGAAIGDRVRAGFRRFGGALVPIFAPKGPDPS